jgi:hypothetical protein
VETWLEADDNFPRRKLVATLVDGAPHGEVRWLGEGGELMSLQHFEHGAQQGVRTDYFPNGDRCAEYHYQGDVNQGTNRFWYENGELSFEQDVQDNQPHGAVITYFPNGNKCVESQYVHGLAQGERYHFLPDGTHFATTLWVDGQQVQQQVHVEPTASDFHAIQQRADYSLALKDHWPSSAAQSAPQGVAAIPSAGGVGDVAPSAREVERALAGRRYRVVPKVLTWRQALAACEALGGRLAIVTDAEQNAFLTQLVRESGLDEAWLGATDEAAEGKWLWVDGSPLAYANWGPGQPNNKQNAEHYLLLWAVQGGVWSDQPDASHQHRPGFICQWEAE